MFAANTTHWDTDEPTTVYFTTAVYPLKVDESLSVGAQVLGATLSLASYSFMERLEVAADVVSITVNQTFFPVDYNKTGSEWSAKDYESVEISGDVLSAHVAATFFPVDYDEWPLAPESLTVNGDILSITVAETFFPVDYENWSANLESLEVVGDVVAVTIETP